MPSCAGAFTNAVRTVWIHHYLELFIVFHQFIDQHFSSLVMHIIIAGTVNHQQITTKIFCIGDW